jgi:hypothetical protein
MAGLDLRCSTTVLLLLCVLQFFPVEVYPVAAPVVLAAGLFTYMVTRTIVSGRHAAANSLRHTDVI